MMIGQSYMPPLFLRVLNNTVVPHAYFQNFQNMLRAKIRTNSQFQVSKTLKIAAHECSNFRVQV